MAILPTSSSISLELTISMNCFAESPSLPDASASSENGSMRDLLDINQAPSSTMLLEQEEDQDQEEEEERDHDHQESIGNRSPYKKLRLTKEQSRLLEECFRQKHTLNPKQKESLAYQLKLKPRQVEVWFQNRRARTKLKHTEMECEYLKRCFGSLTEENKKLQKEVEQLRAMRLISRDQLLPASTITMCPRCERVITTNSSSATCTR